MHESHDNKIGRLIDLAFESPAQVVLYFTSDESREVMQASTQATIFTFGSVYGIATLLESLPPEIRKQITDIRKRVHNEQNRKPTS